MIIYQRRSSVQTTTVQHEDKNEVRYRGHDLQLLPLHASGPAVLVRHLRTH